MLINSIRAMWSIASALCLIFQLPLISFYLFTAGCGSFFINIPVKRMRIKFGRENRIDISLISDQLFIAPILFAFMYCNDPGYQYIINTLRNIEQFSYLRGHQQYTVFAYNTTMVYAYTVLEFFLSIYPHVRFNRKADISAQTKAFLVLTSITYAFLNTCGMEVPVTPLLYDKASHTFMINIPDYMIGNATVINIIFFLFRMVPKHQYANVISLVNFAFGVAGIVHLFHNMESPAVTVQVPLYIILGQFADLFDGRAAERFGSTSYGELLDDIADFTSFGLCTGLYIYRMLTFRLGMSIYISAVTTLAYVLSVLYRLIRFVINKRKAGIKTGVTFFEGYPSPASSAAMNCINCMYEVWDNHVQRRLRGYQFLYFLYLFIVIVITDSKIKYPHFGRVFINSRGISSKVKAMFLTYFILCFWKAIYDKVYVPMLVFVFSFGVFYTSLPLFGSKWLYNLSAGRKQQGETSDESQDYKAYEMQKIKKHDHHHE